MNLNISLIDKEVKAYNTQDLETFCTFFHQEIKVMRLMDGEIVALGMKQFHELYDNFFKRFPKIHCEVKSRMITADVIIDEELITGREDYPDGHHCVVVYGFREGLIDKMWFV